jgi:hypothetical protein
MSKNNSILWLIFLFLFFFCCSLLPRGESSRHPRGKTEKEADSLSFKKDTSLTTEVEYSITREDSIRLEKKKREKPGWETAFPEKVYRVQFFASQYLDEAQQKAALVEAQLSQKTYIDYKVPYYWVRIGDCVTREEADLLLEKMKTLGYRESWVVEVKLKQQ